MRQSGILMPVSALPGAYGIGSFSKEAYKFVDWLQKSGQSLWQILPLGPTSYGDSPYQSFSTFAGNPYFIDLETLAREGLLEDDICRQADFGNNPNQIDYGMLYQNRFHILKVAYEHAKEQQIMNSSDYVDFLNEQNEWLSDYALYMSVKDYFHGAGWNLWEENIRLRRPDAISHYQDLLTDEIHFYQFLYDIMRIDHFRGFDEYYSIPYGDPTAENGHWEKGPGMDLFHKIKQELGDLPIIAEDLGFLTDSVKQLLKDSGYPGMKVLQFAFDSREDSDYLPHNYHPNCVVYTGTHDNDTLQGWYQALKEEDKEMALEYIGNRFTPEADIHWDYIRLAMRSVADTCIIPVQDYLGLGCEARINTPSTLGGNWIWRSDAGSFTDNLAEKIKKITQLCARSLQQKGE